MSELSAEAIAAGDPSGMAGDVLGQGHQLEDALWRAEAAGIESESPPRPLVVCGMGGSAVGGDLATAAIGARARAPIFVSRGYGLPSWVDESAFVLCSSYSGNTEETLAAFEAAGETGARRAVLTTGGELGEAARSAGVPVIGVPSGFQPRAAVAYMVVGSLECAAACGAAPSLRSEIEAASALLRELAEEWGPDSAADSDAKRLAASLRGTVPVIHGAELTAPVAMRWKTQVNENALWPAFGSELPEANHNEICGWDEAGKLGPFSAVFLEGDDGDPRISRRVEFTARAAAEAGAKVERVRARPGSPLEQLMALVHLGDLTTVYWAVLDGTDPTPVEPIERMKDRLAG